MAFNGVYHEQSNSLLGDLGMPPQSQQDMKRLRRTAKKFYARSNIRGFLAVFSDWLIFGICSSSYLLFFWLENKWLFLPIYLFCTVVIASRMRGLENLVHEASHYNLFTTRAYNDVLEICFAIPVFRLIGDYRLSHLTHHAHLGDIRVDPDIIRYERLGINDLPQNYWWILFMRPLTGFHTIEYIGTTFREFWVSRSSRVTKYTFWTAVLLFVTLTNSWLWFLLYWFIPFFLVLPITRFWAEVAEHGSLDLNTDVASSRNNIGFWHRWLLHPHNDGYHEVHHLYPSIPWYQLGAANETLMQDPYFIQYCVESHSPITTFQQLKAPGALRHE